MRAHDLDHLRWSTVVLVLIYHVFYLFNHVGVPGAIAPLGQNAAPDVLLYLVYPWFMVLLFVIAGISAQRSLAHCSGKAFLAARAKKLL
ncbi:MAG: acyltransferase, partial [Oscillospiraceae bacterium]|nr:acyltransferase [Oscillospiraceae bacterium]